MASLANPTALASQDAAARQDLERCLSRRSWFVRLAMPYALRDPGIEGGAV
jgi:hypothetical protein